MDTKPELFIAIDTETTGLNASVNGLCEIAAVVSDAKGIIIDTYQAYCDPSGYEIEPKAMEVNGLDLEELTNYDYPNDAVTFFHKYLAPYLESHQCKAVFHNAAFDLSFLLPAYRQEKLDDKLFRRHLDTMSLAYALLPNHEIYSQEKLAAHFGIVNHRPHSALTDAITLTHIFHKLRKLKLKLKSELSAFDASAYFPATGCLGDALRFTYNNYQDPRFTNPNKYLPGSPTLVCINHVNGQIVYDYSDGTRVVVK